MVCSAEAGVRYFSLASQRETRSAGERLDVAVRTILPDQQQETQQHFLTIIEKQTRARSQHPQETSLTRAGVAGRCDGLLEH